MPKESGAEKSARRGAAYERQYTVNELAEMWNRNRKTIVRMFEDEPGVLKIKDPGQRGEGSNRKTLRIPQSVMERVHAEWSAILVRIFMRISTSMRRAWWRRRMAATPLLRLS